MGVGHLWRPTRQRVEQTSQVGIGGRKRGVRAHNRSKGVELQGRRYARVMMRESEGEEAVHALSVIAHVLVVILHSFVIEIIFSCSNFVYVELM